MFSLVSDVAHPNNPGVGSPWKTRPSSSSPAHHWGTNPPSDPWEAPSSSPSMKMAEQAWRSPARAGFQTKVAFTISSLFGFANSARIIFYFKDANVSRFEICVFPSSVWWEGPILHSGGRRGGASFGGGATSKAGGAKPRVQPSL